jgi:hypothetical protein
VIAVIAVVGATSACDEAGRIEPDAGDAAVMDARPEDRAQPSDGSASEVGVAVDRAPELDAPSTAKDLSGSWYATAALVDAGEPARLRLRVDGATYYLVVNTSEGYCGEKGTFRIEGDTIRWMPDIVEGRGSCPGIAREERVASNGAGFVFDTAGGPVRYEPARAVPKVFVTFEKHDGNLAGDPSLPGVSAVDKADAICDRSIAKPDGATYKALLVDGLHRTAIPARDWVLAPHTTYFQADGVLNVFTTDAAALSDVDSHHGVLPLSFVDMMAWTGIGYDFGATNTCAGWTSRSRGDTASLGSPVEGSRSPFFSYGGECPDRYAFLCVTSPVTMRTTDDVSGALTPAQVALQGAWSTAPDRSAGDRRLRFEGHRYFLVTQQRGVGYCGEVGTYSATPLSVTFSPVRVEGFGRCTIGTSRTEPLEAEAGAITLSSGDGRHRYVRAPKVPKLFATLLTHDGDFANDVRLPGATAMDKADAFCQQSSARPDSEIYRAVLADGATRSLSPARDWVLPADTEYFSGSGLIRLFRTDAGGGLTPALGDEPPIQVPDAILSYMWNGPLRPGTFAAAGSCDGWTSSRGESSGAIMDASRARNTPVTGRCSSRSHGILCASM